MDAAGNLYVVDEGNHKVRRVDAKTELITTVAGTGKPGFGGDNGPATSALLNTPGAIALDAAGNLFIADQANARIRRVAKDGTIATFVGNPAPDGTGGWLYLACAAGLGAWFLKEAVATFVEKDERKEPAAHRLFGVSLVYLTALFASLIVEKLLQLPTVPAVWS